MSERRGERLFQAWKEVEPSFDHASGRARFVAAAQRSKARAARPRSFMMIAATLALGATLVATVLLLWRDPQTRSPSGEALVQVWLETDKSEMPIAFDDGSDIAILAASRGRVEKLTNDGATFLLERGEVRAHVVHRSRTDWRFTAGPFEVRVTGTKLGVAWDPSVGHLVVDVDEGSVVVHGPVNTEDHVVKAGERFVTDVPFPSSPHPENPAIVPNPPPSTSAAPVTSAPAASARSSANPPSWTTFEERGDYDGAYAAATSAGLASLFRASSADELLRLAQVAQLSGHRASEHEALLACRSRFPDSEPAAVAAYELGRGAGPADAVSWFETYLREQPKGPLAREAMGRVVEALASSSEPARAREAAKRYLAAYPEGPHAALARRVIAGGNE